MIQEVKQNTFCDDLQLNINIKRRETISIDKLMFYFLNHYMIASQSG